MQKCSKTKSQKEPKEQTLLIYFIIVKIPVHMQE